MTHKVCEEKVALLAKYQKAINVHSEALARLRETMGTSSKADYDTRFRMTEKLRFVAMTAKEELERHVTKHGC